MQKGPEEESNRSNSFHLKQGMEEGYKCAVSDYLNGKVDLSVFDTERVLTDMYTIGFEIGYLRKLAEIAVY